MKWLYLLIDISSISIPFLFSFHPKIQFYKHWRPFLIGTTAMSIVFLVWDVWFTDMGVWGFNPVYLTGIDIFNLPIEEVLFFVCIPYACTFMYHTFSRHIHHKGLSKYGQYFVTAWALLLIFIAVITWWKYYTGLTFILTAAWLLYIAWGQKQTYQYSFLINFMFVLIPFFIVNGILTGSFIDDQVVWYNDAENLGIRLGTIPIEDSMYGLLMLGLLTTIYEATKSRLPSHK